MRRVNWYREASVDRTESVAVRMSLGSIVRILEGNLIDSIMDIPLVILLLALRGRRFYMLTR